MAESRVACAQVGEPNAVTEGDRGTGRALRDTLPSNYAYRHTARNPAKEKWIEFHVMEIRDEAAAKIWLQEFSEKTLTTWRIQRTYPKAGKINIYRVDLKCHHNQGKRLKGARLTKNTNCPATLQIIIKRYRKNSKSQKNDHTVLKDWPCIIRILNIHNHAIKSAAILQFRPFSEIYKQKLIDLFHKGHSPFSALYCLKTDIFIEHGKDYHLYAADGCYTPSLSVCYHLYSEVFHEGYGQRGGDMHADVEIYLKEYMEVSGGKAIFGKKDDHMYVALCTPLMSRVHTYLPQASELMILDSVSRMEREKHHLYFLNVPTIAGILPLGIIVTDTKSETLLHEALLQLKCCFPSAAFSNQLSPNVILTDTDESEIRPLKDVFPTSQFLFSQVHMLRTMWGWMLDRKNNVMEGDKQEMYFWLKPMLYAKTEEELFHIYGSICDHMKSSYPNFVTFLERFWRMRALWASCYRIGSNIHGNDTTDFFELSYRVLKDCVLDRVLTFNLVQLLDFLVTRYEQFIQKRLLDFYQGKVQLNILKEFITIKGNVSLDNIEPVPGQKLCFFVPREGDTNVRYTVDITTGLCSCTRGSVGRMCKHQSLVMHKTNFDNLLNFSMASESIQKIMLKITTGTEEIPSWLQLSADDDAPSGAAPLRQQEQQHDFYVGSDSQMSNSVSQMSTDSEMAESQIGHRISNEEIRAAKSAFTTLTNRVLDGLHKSPRLFLPAIKRMLHNTDKYAKKDEELLSAMARFGMFIPNPDDTCESEETEKKPVKKRVTRAATAAQKSRPKAKPKNSSRTTTTLRTIKPKKKTNRPTHLKTHDYSRFEKSSQRKRKATEDNSQLCCYVITVPNKNGTTSENSV